MPETVLVNGNAYSLLKLLGKGKGGYSYLAQMADGQQVVVKQIHHEPCVYYQFGNKIEAELRDYNHLHFIQCACRFTENCATCGGERGSKRDEMKDLMKQFRATSDVIESNIFQSVHNINLRTVIGYHKDDEVYNFLDDYNER